MKYDPHEILKKYWGYHSFRNPQEEIIKSVLNGKDTLALLPTGGGKSICFQVPALCTEGICIVISPLVALMKDQVNNLKSRNIKATAIYSGLNREQIDVLLDNCIYGEIKFLYVSPERLKTELFLERASKMNINLFAVDEAHCISQWGYDFRPSYLEIHEFKTKFIKIPTIALTATATKTVKHDILEKLEIKDAAVFIKSFARENLSYSVFKEENKASKLIEILKNVYGSAIIYVSSRRHAENLSVFLNNRRISSRHYHAGLSHKDRDQQQSDWIKNKFKVMVATNAFGMGIDKPDVRVVVHYELPESLEAYYQEAGRAGRDGKKSYAVVLYHENDREELQLKFHKANPSEEMLKKVYQSLANYYKIAVGTNYLASYDFDLRSFCKAYKLDTLSTFHALKKLEEQQLIQFNESFYASSMLKINIDREELYNYQVAHATIDESIKSLLRLYGGELFSNFISISEDQLAILQKSSHDAIKNQFIQMDKQGIISYRPQDDTPKVIFLTARQDIDKLSIDRKILSERRAIKENKVKKIIDYITNKVLCRTQFLQEYFDEISYTTCGICDICLEKKKHSKKLQIQDLKDKINKLKSTIKTTESDHIANILNIKKDDNLIEAIRQLKEEGKLKQ